MNQIEQETPVRQHDPLGKTCRTRRINQRGDALSNFVVDWLGFDFFVQRSDRELTYTRGLADSRSISFRVLPSVWRHARCVDDATSSAVVPDRVDFTGCKTSVH